MDWTPLHSAAYKGRTDIIKMVRAEGVWRVCGGCGEGVWRVCGGRVGVGCRVQVEHSAAYKGRTDIIKMVRAA